MSMGIPISIKISGMPLARLANITQIKVLMIELRLRIMKIRKTILRGRQRTLLLKVLLLELGYRVKIVKIATLIPTEGA